MDPRIQQSYWHMYGSASALVCALGQTNQRLLHWLPSRKNVGSMGSHTSTDQIMQLAAVSWSWVGDKQISVCLSALFTRINLPNQSRVMHWWSHAYFYVILKKSNKSIPWFIRIDWINLIKSPTLVCKLFSLYLIFVTDSKRVNSKSESHTRFRIKSTRFRLQIRIRPLISESPRVWLSLIVT